MQELKLRQIWILINLIDELIQEWKLRCTLSSSPLVWKCGPRQHHLGTDYKGKFEGSTPDLLNSSKGFWGTINFWNQLFSPVTFNPGCTLKSPRKLGKKNTVCIPYPEVPIWLVWGCCLGKFRNSSHGCKEKPGPRTIVPDIIWAFRAKQSRENQLHSRSGGGPVFFPNRKWR